MEMEGDLDESTPLHSPRAGGTAAASEPSSTAEGRRSRNPETARTTGAAARAAPFPPTKNLGTGGHMELYDYFLQKNVRMMRYPRSAASSP